MAEAQEQRPSYRYAVLQKQHELCCYQQSPPVSTCYLCHDLCWLFRRCVELFFFPSSSIFLYNHLVKETVNVTL